MAKCPFKIKIEMEEKELIIKSGNQEISISDFSPYGDISISISCEQDCRCLSIGILSKDLPKIKEHIDYLLLK